MKLGNNIEKKRLLFFKKLKTKSICKMEKGQRTKIRNKK